MSISYLGALFIATASAGGPGVPSGSYLSTCVQVQQHSGTLTATCQDRSGRWTYTALPRFVSCRGGISNQDGQLSCDERSPLAWEVFEQDSFLRSCESVQVERGMLRARCQTVSGAWQSTLLQGWESCSGDIANIDGQLQCRREPERVSLWSVPSGSYLRTCEDVEVHGTYLSATCQRMDGRWVSAALSHYPRCSGDLANINGTLRCTR